MGPVYLVQSWMSHLEDDEKLSRMHVKYCIDQPPKMFFLNPAKVNLCFSKIFVDSV